MLANPKRVILASEFAVTSCWLLRITAHGTNALPTIMVMMFTISSSWPRDTYTHFFR